MIDPRIPLALGDEVDQLRAELNEQARLLGISAEKELALRAENERLKAELKSIDDALDDPRANLTLTTAEIIWEIKAELAKAKKDAERYREWKYRFREGECELFNALADCATDEEHDAAIDAAMKGK